MACCGAQTSAFLNSSNGSGSALRGSWGDSSSACLKSGVLCSGRLRIPHRFMIQGVSTRSHRAESITSAGRQSVYRQVKRLSPRVSAKRKPNGADLNAGDELDEDLRTGLNEVTTEALKVMLAEDDKLVEQFREKVDYLGEYLVQEGHIDAARFMLIIRGMLDHEVYPQKDELKGPYKKAFDKIAALIEDSGWVLKQEGQDVGGVEMVDDELMPPVLNTRM